MTRGRAPFLAVLILVAVILIFFYPAVDGGGAVGSSSPLSTDTVDDAERRTLERLNSFREDQGRASLEHRSALDDVAERHARRMADRDFYSHDVPDGPTFRERIGRVCPRGSETIHRAPIDARVGVHNSSRTVDTRTPTGIAIYLVDGWIGSPEHRRTLLEYRSVGIGIHVDQEEKELLAAAVFC